MLKSATLFKFDKNSFEFAINDILGSGGTTAEVEQGIYLCTHHNFHSEITNEKEEYFNFEDEPNWYSPYGVSDNIEQVKERYAKWLNNPDLNFCISLCKVVKSEQPADGGWRWHKWGEYIGEKDPQCEYLYNEGDDIQEVYCFHLYQLLD